MAKLKHKRDEGWPDFCQVCGKLYPRSDLLRQKVRTASSEGSNHLLYSEGATGWTCAASDAGAVSKADRGYWIQVNMDNTTTHKGGIQSWQGDGRLSADDTVDCSTWSYAYLWASVGKYYRNTYKSATISLGARTNSVDYEIRSSVALPSCATGFGGYLDMSTVPVADRGTMQFYFDVSCENSSMIWYVHRRQLEKDITEFPASYRYIKTSGTARPDVAPSKGLMWLVTCPRHRNKKRIITRNDYYYVPDTQTPISVDSGVD